MLQFRILKYIWLSILCTHIPAILLFLKFTFKPDASSKHLNAHLIVMIFFTFVSQKNYCIISKLQHANIHMIFSYFIPVI